MYFHNFHLLGFIKLHFRFGKNYTFTIYLYNIYDLCVCVVACFPF